MSVQYVTESDWWRRAVAGEPVPVRDGEPEAGYYKARLVKGGPWVPVRIWIEREFGEDGEQLYEDKVCCLVDGAEAGAVERWVYFSAHPISAAEYERLRKQPDPLPAGKAINLAAMPPLF